MGSMSTISRQYATHDPYVQLGIAHADRAGEPYVPTAAKTARG